MVCYMCTLLVRQEALERCVGWKYNSQDGLTPLPPEAMHVWATKPLQHASRFHPLSRLLQVLCWMKVMFLISLGYSQPILHFEQFCSSWYPIQHRSWLPWLAQGCLIRFPSCSPSCCPETMLHNVLLHSLFPCSHGHCSLNQQCKLHLSGVPRVPANSQQHVMCSEF